MKSRFAKIGRSGLLACLLVIGFTEASAGERSEYAGGTIYEEGSLTVEGPPTEEIEKWRTLVRRTVHVVEKLRYPKDATQARGFHHAMLASNAMLASERRKQTTSAEIPDWVDRMVRDYNPVTMQEAFRKSVSLLGALHPGVGVMQAFELDKKMMERNDRFIWNTSCGRSHECLMWTAAKFVKLESEGKETPLMRKMAADLGVLPTNSPNEAYPEPPEWGLAAVPYIEGVLEGVENREPEGQGEIEERSVGNLVRKAETKLGQRISREGLEERIAEVAEAQKEEAQKEETRGGPLREYRQRMGARAERELRADIYASVGTFVSFADPELGRVVAVGFPAFERLTDGLETILLKGFTLASFGDVLGGAAALTSLLESLTGSEDSLARNFRMIQSGLEAVSGQVRTVDRKVDYLMRRLDAVAKTVARTHEEVLELGLRMEQMHRETIGQIGSQSRDIRQIGRYLMEMQKNALGDDMAEVESCVRVNGQTLLHTDRNGRVSDHLRCREKAFNLAWNLAGRTVYTGLDMPGDLATYFESSQQYDAADAHWVAGHWGEMVEEVVSAKVEALNAPARYRGVFEEGERQTPGARTVAMELSAMRDGSAINPAIWHQGIEQYVKLERQRGADVPANDETTRQLIDSARQMNNLLKMIEDGNLAYNAMELHLWNAHLMVQVLKGLWSEYLETKSYRFTTCTKEEFAEARRRPENGPDCYTRWSYGWKGNDDLLFDYWSNGNNEEHLPTGNPEKIQVMVRLLRANDGKDGVESLERRVEVPEISYHPNVRVYLRDDNNSVQGSGLFSLSTDFPAIFGDVYVSWSGCLRVAVEHRIVGRDPFGTEEIWGCVGDEPMRYGSDRRRRFVEGSLKHGFEPPPPGDRDPTWCVLRAEGTFLQNATYRGRRMVYWSRDGSAYIREGSLVLNQIGTMIDWEKPDESYENPDIRRDAYRLSRYAVDEAWRKSLGGTKKRSCAFHVLWGVIDRGGFFSDTLYVDERYGWDPLAIETTQERHEVLALEGMKDDEAVGQQGDEAYREQGALLIFDKTSRHKAYLEEHLGWMIFHQEVARIFDTVKREMVSEVRRRQLASDNPNDLERQDVTLDVAEYEYATDKLMARFVEWATDEANMRREVDLDWPVFFRTSLGDAQRRLDGSWEAVQVLSRIVAGTCAATPAGTSFEALARDLASGKDVIRFLKGEVGHESRFQSWSELRGHGLLGVTSTGLVVDAAQLRERVGAMDRWPLQTEVWLATYGEGAILLASLEAAMEVARDAARRSGIVVASENDVQEHELEAVRRRYGRAVATVSRRELEKELREHEIAIWRPPGPDRFGQQGIKIMNAGRAEGSSRATKENIVATGIPITWMHKDNEISAFDVAVRSVSMTLHEALEPTGASEVEKQAKENFVRHVQSRIGDILVARECRPGIDEFDDGTKQLESVIVE